MPSFTFEVTKTIVITVESDNCDMARDDAEIELSAGDYDSSWDKAEPTCVLIGEEEEK